ncbi:MAG: polysaccharide biosynthesis/export family protein [Chitinophagaceae bacterium]|nr:polysaccharide biosynthesis/export family protein [Chitinophagaceae bacterium]
MKRILVWLLIVMCISSCKVFYPDRLFKTDKDFPLVSADSLHVPKEYVIRPGDLLAVDIFSNNGYELVDVLSQENGSTSALNYVVKEDGYVMLPLLDSVPILGYSLSEAEKFLQQKYSYYFVNPFVRVDVVNRRAYVYRGRQGAEVVILDKENMNLLEVLASAGGMPSFGKADRVRVLRGDLRQPTVFDVDLSTVEGMMQANLRIEANDIIYIDAKLGTNDVLYQITPILTLVSTILVIYTTILAINGQ